MAIKDTKSIQGLRKLHQKHEWQTVHRVADQVKLQGNIQKIDYYRGKRFKIWQLDINVVIQWLI